MKSKINTLTDYKSIPFEKEVVLTCDPKEIDKKLHAVARTKKQMIPVESIENGDVTLLKLESTLPKFNKENIFVTAGSNLFHEEFEKTLLNKSLNETYKTKIDDEEVTVTIKKIQRTIFPEVTDAMVVEYLSNDKDYSDIKGIDDYIERIKEESKEDQKQRVYGNAVNALYYGVLTTSDFDFDDEELRQYEELLKNDIIKSLEEEDKVLENLTKIELEAYFGISSLEDLDKEIKSGAEFNIAGLLWEYAVLGKDATKATLEDYATFEFLYQYVEENITFKEE